MRGCKKPATFQSLMNEMLHDCVDKFFGKYINDLLKFSKDRKHHYKFSKVVLEQLEVHQLYASLGKCKIPNEEIDFLGMPIGKNGITLHPKSVTVL